MAMLLLQGMVACDDKPSGSEGLSNTPIRDFPVFREAHLKQGREIWLGTCKDCHASGVAGAPVAGNKVAWAPRVAKGRDVLYQHAIEGFFGPEYTQMPAKGGNTSLSDEQVMKAVDYMLALVTVVE